MDVNVITRQGAIEETEEKELQGATASPGRNAAMNDIKLNQMLRGINALTERDPPEQMTSARPPQFQGRAGENFTEWLSKFNHYCDFQNWKDAKKLSAIPLSLTGMAWDFYSNLPATKKETYTALTHELTQKYDTTNLRWVDEQNLLSRKMGLNEPLETFLEDITARCAKLGKTPAERLNPFIHGLTSKLKAFVIAKNPTTIDEAILYARLGESVGQIDSPSTVSIVDPSESKLDTLVSAISSLQKEVKQIKFQRHPDFQNRNRYSRPNFGNQGRNIGRSQQGQFNSCRFCKRVGHIESECRTKSYYVQNKLCFKCKTPGHVSKFCQKGIRSEN